MRGGLAGRFARPDERTQHTMMKTVIAAVLAAVLAGALGFYGGVTYQKTQTPSFGGRFANGGGGFGGNGGGFGGPGGNRGNFAANVATGTVMAIDSTSITVKTADGGSKKIFVTSQTQVGQQQQLTLSDIKVGDQVGAFGQQSNGGIDARTVEVVPPGQTFRFGGMGGGRAFFGGAAGGQNPSGGSAPSGQ